MTHAIFAILMSALPPGESLLPGGGLKLLILPEKKEMAQAEVAALAQAPGGEVLRVTTLKEADPPWDVQATVATAGLIHKGDVVYAHFYLRTLSAKRESGEAQTQFVLERLGDLSPNIAKFGHALRDFRNYVHPAEQLAHHFSPDQHTARIGFQVVVAAADDLVRAEKVVAGEITP